MSEPSLAQHDDIYLRKPIFRWLALLAALLAWGFDGVEQGVYSIMTRPALKEIIPGIPELVRENADLLAKAKEAEPNAANELRTQAKAVGNRIDQQVGRFYGWSIAMWLWGAAVGGVIFGRLGDRLGRVKTLSLAVLTYAIFTGLSALSGHWTHLVVFRFLGALGLGGTWPLCVALVVETWPENRRAILAGAIGAAANVGYLIAAVYSQVMRSYGYNWRAVIAMGCVIGLLSLPIIFAVPEPTKWKQSRAKRERSNLSDLFTRRYIRATIVGSLLSTVGLLGTWGSFLWLATYMDKIAEGTVYASNASSIVSRYQSFGQILGGFMGGVLAGWLGNRKSYILLCLTAFASVFSLWRYTDSFDVQAVTMAIIAGVFVTAFFGWLPKYLPELYPTRIRASGQGFAYNIGRVLAGFGALGAGELVRVFHGSYQMGGQVMSGIYLFGLVIILFAPNTGGKMAEEDEHQVDAQPQLAISEPEARARV